jgi:NADH-quinone oxidoreductase subunit H
MITNSLINTIFLFMELLIGKSILAFGIFAITLLIATYSTYAERKIAAFIQDRLGPDRAGPFGIFQPLADAVKMFMKEEIIPTDSNKFLFILGPCLSMITALITSAVIPWSKDFVVFGFHVPMQVADINIGILYVFGMVSLGVYGVMIGGWSSNNKFSLLGAIRASSQMISYELAMGLSVIALVMMAQSLSIRTIVEQQHGFLHWNVFIQPLGFILFITCAFAECNRAPFDLPECESELIGGYHTEYSSMKLGFYLFAEYINMFVSSAMISALFFGGYNFPFMYLLEGKVDASIISIIGLVVFFSKIFFFIFFFMWVRWTLPRFRYDQLMRLGWKMLIPLALLNILISAGVITLRELF